MAQFQQTVDIWTLNDEARASLQPGQWVQAGPSGPVGRWVGMTGGSSAVAAWNENAKRSPRGFHGYWQALRDYQQTNKGI